MTPHFLWEELPSSKKTSRSWCCNGVIPHATLNAQTNENARKRVTLSVFEEEIGPEKITQFQMLEHLNRAARRWKYPLRTKMYVNCGLLSIIWIIWALSIILSRARNKPSHAKLSILHTHVCGNHSIGFPYVASPSELWAMQLHPPTAQ